MSELESASLVSSERVFSTYRTATKVVGLVATVYSLILALICIGAGLVVFPILLLLLAILLGILSLHFLSRLVLNYEGIRKEYFYGHKTPYLPWNSITVTASNDGVYTVQGNGSSITFKTDMARFDEVLNIIRAHHATVNCTHEPPVDRDPSRSQPFPDKIPHKFFNYTQTPVGLQTVMIISCIIVAITFPQIFSVAVWVPCVLLYCLLIGFGVFALFSYITLQENGLEIASNYFFKKYYSWNDIGYIRFVRARKATGGFIAYSSSTVTLLRVHAKSGDLLTEMQYHHLAHHEDIVNGARVQGIPILSEAEPYGPQSQSMEMRASKYT